MAATHIYKGQPASSSAQVDRVLCLPARGVRKRRNRKRGRICGATSPVVIAHIYKVTNTASMKVHHIFEHFSRARAFYQ